ncbi:MAG: AAA family ATPase [Chitinispirillales bacterium]|nr:AAA family ATPase [Chitinispirillales bacterium]
MPTGIQDFPKIRESGCVYVDKTPQIYPLISGTPGAFFLSRPRRFGKSLLCSTLGAIFEGRRDLFGEIAGRPALAMDSLDWEWKAHPVIHLDLNAGNYKKGGGTLNSVLYAEMRREAKKYGIAIDRTEKPAAQFKYLIEEACEKIGEKAVVIIDEYDKPLTGTLGMRDVHVELRDALKEFYGVLKSYDACLRLIFITGVSKFSHVSIFSDLNQVTDLTLSPRYADLCGLTQEELEANFEPEIEEVLKNTGRSREAYIVELRHYYNGYRFSKNPLKVYNQSSLLNHFYDDGRFLNYWYERGTPSFLVNLLEQKKINITEMNDMRAMLNAYESYELDGMMPAVSLYPSGYLTISGYEDETGIYTLDFPNEEVRASFAELRVEHCR